MSNPETLVFLIENLNAHAASVLFYKRCAPMVADAEYWNPMVFAGWNRGGVFILAGAGVIVRGNRILYPGLSRAEALATPFLPLKSTEIRILGKGWALEETARCLIEAALGRTNPKAVEYLALDTFKYMASDYMPVPVRRVGRYPPD